MSEHSKALAVVTGTSGKSAPVHFLKQTGKTVAKLIGRIHRSEHDTAFFALVVSSLCWQAKANAAHGEFKPWVRTHVGERAYRSVAYYMQLGLRFAEKSKITNEEFLQLATLNPKGAKSGPAKSAFEKVEKFIGEHSLTELLIKHGVKGVGLKGELTAGDEAPPALTAGEQMDLVWSQAYEPAKSLADLLTERAATLAPDRRDAIAAELQRALQALRSV